MRNTIQRLQDELDRPKLDNIYDLLGLDLDDETREGINSSIEFAKEQLNSYFEAYTAAADAKVAKSEKEVDAAQKALDKEIELREKGYANNVATAQKELDMAKNNQEKALKEQEKAQKRQAAIQTLQQAGNLVTASAKIWAQLGFPYAIPAVAVMWASFAAAKIKSMQMTKSEQYGEGTVEMLHGGSHASGNDIDLGTKPDGTRRRAEGGEFFAVINKRNSRRYRSVIPSLINSINSGNLENVIKADDKALTTFVGGESPDISGLADDVRAIKKQGETRHYTDNGMLVEVYKNCTRRIRKQ